MLSLRNSLIQKAGKRAFSVTQLKSYVEGREHLREQFRIGQAHFDTRKFVTELEKHGFTQTQAVAVLNALSSVLDDSVEHLASNLVSREEFSRRVYQQKVDFTKLKSELQGLDKAEVTRVGNEHERLATDIEKLRQKFKEAVAKSKANVRLDLNLEKGRIREESAVHESKIKETDTRIEQELANFKTQIEGTKVQVAQWLIGVCTGVFAMVLAYIRLLT
jgi:archaellum component FlaC